MLIDEPAAFSLVIPTFNGTPLLRRTLDYLAAVGFKGQVVLSDNSAPTHRAFVEACPGKYPKLALQVFSYPEPTRFLVKLARTFEALSSRCVMLHAHDDFFVPDETEACVQLLESRPEYSVARGRVAMFRLTRPADQKDTRNLELGLASQPMRAYEQDHPLERVIDHVGRFAPTFYSVHRRTHLIENYHYTEARTRNVIFFQYLSSAIATLQGKVHCSDRLFYARQRHEESWSTRLSKDRDYEHWPQLITSPDFSRYYGEFRNALCEWAVQRHGADPEAFGKQLDLAAVELMGRSFCGAQTDNPEDDRFLRQLNSQTSAMYAHMRRLASFVANYPDTF